MRIEVLSSSSAELSEEMERLIPQLSSSAQPLDAAGLERMMSQDCLHLLVARGEEGEVRDQIVGMLSLIVFEIPTGVRAWVEDVVTDEAVRGQGVGQALVEAAIERAQELGARTVDLTSRPTREAANRLYRRTGFVQRETNVYRMSMES